MPQSQSWARQTAVLQCEPEAARQGVLEGVGLPCYNGGLNVTFFYNTPTEECRVRLYHRWIGYKFFMLSMILWVIWLSACTSPQVTQESIVVSILADDKSYQVQIPPGSNVQDALNKAGITLNELDRSTPPLFTILSNGSKVTIVRVNEEYFIEQVVIPFEHQELRNEALTLGERILSQSGVNGLQENTYRRVYENGIEIQNTVIESEIIQDAIPEIVMVGSQTPYASLIIPGKIAYLSAGNAWVMDGTTANRKAVVTTGDLDGHVFSLSYDGDWLLFTRAGNDEDTINQLWAARIDDDRSLIINLGVTNVVHFADWGASRSVVGYSTVEPRSTAPGWQANNDLAIIGVSPSGFVSPAQPELEINSGGVYGWWGMDFSWANDGVRLVYARPDSIGIYDTRLDSVQPLISIAPFQTGGDWAWVPGIRWSPDDNAIYSVQHVASQGSLNIEESPRFDLIAIPLSGGGPVSLVEDVGMFAYPEPSPLTSNLIVTTSEGETTPVIENAFRVAYLQAIFPGQSQSSRYRLFVMDRDGSNRLGLFPTEGATGIEPQQVKWSPYPVEDMDHFAIALIFQGNIWLVDAVNGKAQQITGDGLTVRLDWR